MKLFKMVRAQMQACLPFVNHNGIEILTVGDGVGEAMLVRTAESLNHVGLQHAGALFTVGEAASGAAMLGALAPRAMTMLPLAAGAEITYHAVARDTIVAKARTDRPGAELLAELDAAGKVAFDVEVDLADEEGNIVAEMKVSWNVKGRKQPG